MRTVNAILVGALLLTVGLAAVFVVSHQPGFTGERIKNPNAYLLDIRKMNGTDRHTLNLTAGDVLQVAFKTEKGSLRMEITAPDGTPLWRVGPVRPVANTLAAWYTNPEKPEFRRQ